MKRALPLLAALLFCACGPSKEKEPNEEPGTASPARAGKIEGTLSKASDVDVYKLDVRDEPSQLSLRLGGIRDADFVLSILDRDRRELKRYDETATGGDEEAADIGLKQGAAYIRVSNKNERFANSSQGYVIDVKVTRGPGKEAEPNETQQSASKLDLPGVTRGHHFPSRNLLADDTGYAESDWYKLEITQAGLFLLNVDLTEVSKVDPVMEVYDVNGYKLREVDSGGVGQGESLKNFGLRGPVTYFVRLRAKAGGANAEVPYEILTELLPYQGRTEFEPNDQRVDATPFAQDSINGAIAPEGDQDWYKAEVTEDSRQILRAAVTGVDGMDLILQVADGLGSPLITIDNMGKGQPETMTGLGVTKGEYYLVVSEKTGKKADGRMTYSLTKGLTAFQPGLEAEVNDSTAAVQPVKIGEAVDGYFAPKGDVDHYEFNVYNKGVVVFELAGVLNVQPSATLIGQEGAELQSWSAAKLGDSLLFEKELEPGTYSIRLRPAKDEQNNVRDKYSLRLKLK